MARIDQSNLRGKIRDREISPELESLLLKAAAAAGIDVVFVTSGGQPGTSGRSVGSTRHNGGRAADLYLQSEGRVLSFSDSSAPEQVERFVTAAAAHGANGIGAGVDYMGPRTLHIGFGATRDDHRNIVWGAGGRSANAPGWLRRAADLGWENPPSWAFQVADSFHREDAEEEDDQQPQGRGEAGVVIRPLQQGDADPVRVGALQQRLHDLGYMVGGIDGKFGPLTAEALLAFQNENGVPTSGVLDERTAAALLKAEPRRLADKRVKATEKDLAADGSRIIRDAGWTRFVSWLMTGLGAVGVGNSAIINATGTGQIAPRTNVTADAILPFLAELQKLGPTPDAAQIAKLSEAARLLSSQIANGTLSPGYLQAFEQLRGKFPADVISRNPDFARILETILPMATPRGTIFDILPTFFKDGTILQTIMNGVAAVGASTMPGFAGSLAILGAGLASKFLANQIAAARVEDHNTGANRGR
jgi:peptidoglycan hydrolase-like protein with peptidoglycan-binding domain